MKLQHIYENYTTEEHVDTILSLSIPIDTADCYIDVSGNRYVRSQNEGEQDDTFLMSLVTHLVGQLEDWSKSIVQLHILCFLN